MNVGLNRATTLNQLLDALRKVVGPLPEVNHGPARAGDIRHSRADNARLLARFDLPEPTPLADEIGRAHV